MSFKEAILNVFNNYANFNGRARRSEYWYFVLFTTLINSVLAGLQNSAGEGTVGSFFGMLAGLFSLATLIPGLAVCWRRLHDIGKSGGYYFLILIPPGGRHHPAGVDVPGQRAGDEPVRPQSQGAAPGRYFQQLRLIILNKEGKHHALCVHHLRLGL